MTAELNHQFLWHIFYIPQKTCLSKDKEKNRVGFPGYPGVGLGSASPMLEEDQAPGTVARPTLLVKSKPHFLKRMTIVFRPGFFRAHLGPEVHCCGGFSPAGHILAKDCRHKALEWEKKDSYYIWHLY